ncbi:hypothetical protein [Acidovorax sp. 1608163]|nr:hypothetical protein [Acidovorax sp. 1608163]
MGDAAGSTARTGSRVSQPMPVNGLVEQNYYQNNSFQRFIHLPHLGFLL